MNLRVAAWLVCAGLALSAKAGCSAEPGRPTGDGAVDAAWLEARKLDYLRFATAALDPASVTNVLAHLERARVDPGFAVADAGVPADAWDERFEKMAGLQDTRDFDALYLAHLLFRFRDHPMLAPGLGTAVEQALLDFKYWYTEPTAEGLRDDSWYWSENHAIIFHALEYLMGQRYPNAVFGNDGRTGAQHEADARPRIQTWLEHRLRFGFSEWHSNVYYQKDVTPLLTLIEYAGDEDIRTLSAAVLDLVLFDMALHLQRGAFGATRGRSYKKDKMTSLDEDTWGITKLLFDDTEHPYQSRGDAGATILALSGRYDVPEAIRRIAGSEDIMVDRERMGIPLDEEGPPWDGYQAPYGLSFDDPESLTVWWSMGAYAAWPVVPLTIDTLNAYDLWETPAFQQLEGVRPLADDPGSAQFLTSRLAPMVNLSLLNEVNTYTWRSPEIMLSSAVDYRAGSAAAQAHAWQATIDARAIVFTNHPFRPLEMSTDWRADPETGGYWNGEASMPRSAQHENVAIHIYAPQYARENTAPLEFFRWEPYTHAYFPQDHFDEVVQDGHWTFGRKGEAFIALYSHRPATFRVYDPAVYATNGMVEPFDLVAEGGADNVWIVECGRAADWGSFDDFRAAIAATRVDVVSLGPGQENGVSDGFDVVYQSPSQGELRFGWRQPFTVDGEEIALRDFPRYDNPWSFTPPDSDTIELRIEDYGVFIDRTTGERLVYGPPR